MRKIMLFEYAFILWTNREKGYDPYNSVGDYFK